MDMSFFTFQIIRLPDLCHEPVIYKFVWPFLCVENQSFEILTRIEFSSAPSDNPIVIMFC